MDKLFASARAGVVGVVLAGLTALLAGCPAAKKEAVVSPNPPVKIRENTANDNKDGKQVVDSGSFQVNRPAEGESAPPTEGAAIPDPPNPRPTGDHWVFAAKLHGHVGDKLPVEYMLTPANPGKAWIGLIPEDVTATDSAANDVKDVSYVYTTDATSATVDIVLSKPGKFRLRLFSGNGPDDVMVGETPLLTVVQWPKGNLISRKAPYITINPSSAAPVEVKLGQPVTAGFAVPPGYSDKGWVGVIPADTISVYAGENDVVDVNYMWLQGKLSGDFVWNTDKPGKYVFRIFPSSENDAEWVAESEPFTVLPKS